MNMSDNAFWAFCVLAAATFLIILVVCLNRTNWVGLENGYCQTTVAGAQSLAWVKCR